MTGGKLDTAGLAVLMGDRQERMQAALAEQKTIIAVLEHALKFYAGAPDGDIARQALAKLDTRRQEASRAA